MFYNFPSHFPPYQNIPVSRPYLTRNCAATLPYHCSDVHLHTQPCSLHTVACDSAHSSAGCYIYTSVATCFCLSGPGIPQGSVAHSQGKPGYYPSLRVCIVSQTPSLFTQLVTAPCFSGTLLTKPWWNSTCALPGSGQGGILVSESLSGRKEGRKEVSRRHKTSKLIL